MVVRIGVCSQSWVTAAKDPAGVPVGDGVSRWEIGRWCNNGWWSSRSGGYPGPSMPCWPGSPGSGRPGPTAHERWTAVPVGSAAVRVRPGTGSGGDRDDRGGPAAGPEQGGPVAAVDRAVVSAAPPDIGRDVEV